MNVHDILTQGSGNMLGPIKINKVYPISGDGARRKLFCLIEDPSGKSALNIWGAAANAAITEGCQINIVANGPKGGLQTQEYPAGSGKFSINANDCRVTILSTAVGYDSGHAEPAPYTPSAQPVPVVSHIPQGLTTEQLAEKFVDLADKTFNLSRDKKHPLELSIGLAIQAPQNGALWWFGEKWPGKTAGQ